MYYRCIKVQHKPIKIQVRDPIQRSKKDLSVLWSGAPDCPMCHLTVSGALGPYKVQPATLRKTEARSAIIHRTVRCATGLSGVPAEQRLSTRNGRLCKVNSAIQNVRAEVRSSATRDSFILCIHHLNSLIDPKYSIKYFSTSFSLLSFALKRCNFRF